MALAVEHGIAGAPWADPRPGAHVARAARFIMLAQVEAGITCPLAMTYSCVPALRLEPGRGGALGAARHERRLRPARDPGRRQARSARSGMALTERGGGSDVRAGTATTATPAGDGTWTVDGAKWFVSAAQSDAFFVLAQTSGGLSLVLVPRLTTTARSTGCGSTGSRTSSATAPTRPPRWSSTGARGIARRRGGPRRARDHGDDRRHPPRLRARLRRGHAAGHRRGRSTGPTDRRAFGRELAAQPAMQAVLADLALESEAATAGALRLARAHEQAHAGDAAGRAAAPDRRPRPEVLDLQARAAARRGGARVPGRVRLHRGLAAGPRLPRGAADVGLGGLGERAGARRPARAGPRARGARRPARRDRRGQPAPTARLDAELAALRRDAATLRRRGVRAAARGPPRARAAGVAAGARTRPPAVADAFCATRLGDPAGPHLRRAARRASTSARSSRARGPPHEGRRDPARRADRRGRAQPRPPRGPDRAGRARARAGGDLPPRVDDDEERLRPPHAARRAADRRRAAADAPARRARRTTASSAAATSRSAGTTRAAPTPSSSPTAPPASTTRTSRRSGRTTTTRRARTTA